MKNGRIKTQKSSDGHRASVVAANGNILVTTSEAYRHKADALQALKSSAIIVLKALLAVALFFGPLRASAQVTDTNLPPILSGPAVRIIQFLSSGSNWMFATYGIYSSKGLDGTAPAYGGGVGAFIKVNDFVVTGMRLDTLAVNHRLQLWMPEVNIQLQMPMTLFGKRDPANNQPVAGTGLTLIPFVVGGAATPLAGMGKDNGTLVGIFGLGMAVRVAKHWDIVYDWEQWSGFAGDQHRFGALYKF